MDQYSAWSGNASRSERHHDRPRMKNQIKVKLEDIQDKPQEFRVEESHFIPI